MEGTQPDLPPNCLQQTDEAAVRFGVNAASAFAPLELTSSHIVLGFALVQQHIFQNVSNGLIVRLCVRVPGSQPEMAFVLVFCDQSENVSAVQLTTCQGDVRRFASWEVNTNKVNKKHLSLVSCAKSRRSN